MGIPPLRLILGQKDLIFCMLYTLGKGSRKGGRCPVLTGEQVKPKGESEDYGCPLLWTGAEAEELGVLRSNPGKAM